MIRSLLPPRGIFIPTRMIFNHLLPPAVLITWIQLRCLAWDGRVTPSLSMQELTILTGKGKSTLYAHMSHLRAVSALRWRSAGQDTIIISFPDEPTKDNVNINEPPNFPDSKMTDYRNTDLDPPSSYFPAQILGYLSIQDEDEGFSKDNHYTLFT